MDARFLDWEGSNDVTLVFVPWAGIKDIFHIVLVKYGNDVTDSYKFDVIGRRTDNKNALIVSVHIRRGKKKTLTVL